MKKRVTKGARPHLHLVSWDQPEKTKGARKPVDPSPLLIDMLLADLGQERARRHARVEARYREALRRFLEISSVAEFRELMIIVAERRW